MHAKDKWAKREVVVSVVGVLVAIVICLADRSHTDLKVETLANVTADDMTAFPASKFKLPVNDMPVDRVAAATIEVNNIGKRAIEPTDYDDRAPVFNFAPTRVLAATFVHEEALSPPTTLSRILRTAVQRRQIMFGTRRDERTRGRTPSEHCADLSASAT